MATDQKRWSAVFIRNCLTDHAYRPHPYEEVAALVDPEVAASLAPDARYGVWWYNRKRQRRKQTVENGPSGKVYRKQRYSEWKPKEEWIAVPIPDSGIPREWIDAAREAIKNNRFATSAAGGRYWELSGGVVRRGGCERSMSPDSHHNGSGS